MAISNGSEKESRWGKLRARARGGNGKSWSTLAEAGETQKAAENRGEKREEQHCGVRKGGKAQSGGMEAEGEEREGCSAPREGDPITPTVSRAQAPTGCTKAAEGRWLLPELVGAVTRILTGKKFICFFSQDILSDFAV